MLELRIMQGRKALPIFDLPTRLGKKEAAREIGHSIEGLIAFLDDLHGDPDLEDSETSSGMVDASGRYMGDTLYLDHQDEDREPDDDAQGDVAWIEHHTRGRHKLGANGEELLARGSFGRLLEEDDEDDDPDEPDDDTEANGDEKDTGNAEDESLIGGSAAYHSGPGCPISDEGGCDDGV